MTGTVRRGSGRNILFPRDAVPMAVGVRIRRAREERGFTQSELAAEVGVTRWTIGRVEAGRHVPSSTLVHALERVLELAPLVPGWKDPADYDAPARGPRARRARKALGLTLEDVSRLSGVGVATISRFERECGDTPLILGADFERDDGFANDAYARAHRFRDAEEMEEYANAFDVVGWLAVLVRR